MVTKNLSKRPVTMLGCGGIKATIWKTVSKNKPFFARPFLRRSRISPVPRITAIHSGSMISNRCSS